MLRAALTALALSLSAAPAAEHTFAWNPNPEDDIAGYRLHFGSESGRYPKSIECGNVTRFTVDIDWDSTLKIGTDRFTVVTAYNTAGLESFPSNEIDLGGTPPSAPKNPRVTLSGNSVAMYLSLPPGRHVVSISDDLREWDDLGEAYGIFGVALDRARRKFIRYQPD